MQDLNFEDINLIDMYGMIDGSPVTQLGESIGHEQTSFKVEDITKLPNAPNIVTIYDGEYFETIYYENTDSNYLTEVERGIAGQQQDWESNSFICRLLTNKDIETIHDNIKELKTEIEEIHDILIEHRNELQELNK